MAGKEDIHLCWTCKNSTSCDKCPFVARLNRYYKNMACKYTADGIPLVRDLTDYYIKGTEIDENQNIIKCPLYKFDNMDYRTEFQKIIDESACSAACVTRKKTFLREFTKEMQEMSDEEKKQRQEAFYNYLLEKREKEKQPKKRKYTKHKKS